jgi:hypothetical protein
MYKSVEVCVSVKVCIRAWEYVSERESMYKSVEVCQSVKVCIRAWEYV